MAKNWAIAIGINQYRFLQPLSYAVQDATAMRQFLLNDAGFDQVLFFTDDSPAVGGKSTEPFRTNLLRVMRQIFEQPFMGDGDSVWFFFSGHGIRHQEQDYLMPLDGDPEDVEHTGIATQTITDYLRQSGADNVVMILDACRNVGQRSGLGIGRGTEQVARQKGVISLFSCSPEQSSYEVDTLQQGIFTTALLEAFGMEGQCATVEQVNRYLAQRVPTLAQQYNRPVQVPYTIAEPISKTHLILLPKNAKSADIALLKQEALHAEVNHNPGLARQLWIRVIAASGGQDVEAIAALDRVTLARDAHPPTDDSTTTANRSISRNGFLKLAVPAGIGVVGVSLLGLVGKLLTNGSTESTSSQGSATSPESNGSEQETNGSDPQPQPEISPEIPTEPDPQASEPTPDFPTSSLIDTSRLQQLLMAGDWRLADIETKEILSQYLDDGSNPDLREDLENLPCEVAVAIDHLWSHFSEGRFGLSVQAQIWQECGGSPSKSGLDGDSWQCFEEEVGWIVNGSMLNIPDLTFDLSAPVGHLPFRATTSFQLALLHGVNGCDVLDS